MALLAAGCSNPALDDAIAARKHERARLYAIAEDLDGYKKRVDAAASPIEKQMRIWRADGNAGAALTAVGSASESPVGFRKLDDGRSRFTLGGRGGAAGMARALERLAGVAPGFLFETTSVDAAGAWTIEVETQTAWKPELTKEATALLAPIPPPGALESGKAKRQRAEIVMIDREIAELGRLVGEAAAMQERLAIAEHETARAKAPDSVGAIAPWISRVFGPVLASGTATRSGDSLNATGTLAKGLDAEKLATMSRGTFDLVSVSPPTVELARPAAK